MCAIKNPRLSWTTLHGLNLRLQGWDLILSPCSVLPRYLRLGGLPGLIHWKIVETWLKNQIFSQQKLTLTSRTKILNKINGKQKGKACQNKLNSFFLLWKRDGKLMKIWWKKFSGLKWYQIFRNLLIPNTENQKKTLIMRKQLPFRGLRKNRRITVTY